MKDSIRKVVDKLPYISKLSGPSLVGVGRYGESSAAGQKFNG